MKVNKDNEFYWFFRARWRQVKRAIRYIKCALFSRHNVIKLDIPPTWCDRSHLLLLAMEKLVVDYIEEEKPFELINWDSDEGHRTAAEKMRDVYDFIKNRRPKQQAEIDKLSDELYGSVKGENLLESLKKSRDPEKTKYLWDLEDKLEKEQQEILHKIVDVRNYLWT